jgi:hypothetical protein
LIPRPDWPKLAATKQAQRECAASLAMASILARGFIGTCLVLGPLLAHGDVTPARLREDEYSIESLLQVPDDLERRRSYDVHCEVLVQMTGRPRDCSCYALDPSVPRKLVNAVSRAGARSRFVPATRDGKPIEIYMLLMVRVMLIKNEPLVLVLPNNGIERKRYGLFYIAPQRLNEFYWGRDETYFNEKRSNPDVLIWEEFWIDEHGKVTDYRLTNASGASMAVEKAVRDSAAKMQFMPGFVEGKPMAMHYIEPAYSIRD